MELWILNARMHFVTQQEMKGSLLSCGVMRNVLCYSQCSHLERRKPLLSFRGFQTAFPPLSPTISPRTAQTSQSLFLGLALKCLLEGKVLWGKNQSTQKQISGFLEAGVGEGDASF